MPEGKVCMICAQDCTDRPRIKNSKGQYACRACVAKTQKAPAAKSPAATPSRSSEQRGSASRSAGSAAAPVTGVAAMEEWMSQSTRGQIALGKVEQPKCAQCQHPMMPGEVICMGCGMNTQSGKKVRTRIQKAEKTSSGGGGGVSISAASPSTLAAISLLAAVGLIAATALAGELGVLFVLVAVVWAVIAGILMIVAAFQDGDKVWGIIGLCQFVPFIGQFASLPFAFYYCTVGSTRTGRKISYWMSFITVFGCLVALFMSNPDLMSEP